MPRYWTKTWANYLFNCLLVSIFSTGCNSLPLNDIQQTSNPCTKWTTKENGNPLGSTTRTPFGDSTQTKLIEPTTLVHFFITIEDHSTTPICGNSVVGPDGTVVLGGFGSVKIGGLTTLQATTVMEAEISRFYPNPKVKLTIGGPIQPVQAFGDWAPLPTKVNNTAPLGLNPWQNPNPVTGPPVLPNNGIKLDKSLLPTQNPSPELSNNNSWQLQPGGIVPRVQPSQDETGPAPKTLNNNSPENEKSLDPIFHPQSQIAVYPQVPTEVKPVTMPTYIVGPPDILQIDSVQGLITQPVRGPHLIRPDGTIGVGIYGSVYVAGMTLEQAKEAIARVIHARLDPTKKKFEDVLGDLSVDVLAYNSKVYYVITDRVGFGEIVSRFPITGYETVLDAISQLSGLPPEASKRHIWVARRCPDGKKDNILPVDWIGISQKGLPTTNYQLLPGDRVYVQADRLITFNYVLSKFLAPIERLFGVSLLASQTVNSIKSGTSP